MPLYSHQCPVCSGIVENLQSINASRYAPRCGKCGCKMLRVISAPAVQYKGTGWAKQDRKKEGK